MTSSSWLTSLFFFFFKQKTAYEIGLGIPAEPLFRSSLIKMMAATETITSIILIKLIRVSLGTVRHPRRFKIVVIDIQITLKQMRSEERRVGKECKTGWGPYH